MCARVSIYITVSNDELIDRYKKECEAWIEHLNSAIFPKLAKEYAKEVKSKSKDLISDFYNSYNPRVYKRKGSLYKVIIAEAHGVKFRFGLDESKIKKRRADSEYIYNLTLVEGWHGGALRQSEGKQTKWKNFYMNQGVSDGEAESMARFPGGGAYWRKPRTRFITEEGLMIPKWGLWYDHPAANANINTEEAIFDAEKEYWEGDFAKYAKKTMAEDFFSRKRLISCIQELISRGLIEV